MTLRSRFAPPEETASLVGNSSPNFGSKLAGAVVAGFGGGVVTLVSR